MDESKWDLKVLPDNELPELRELYRDVAHAPYVFSFIETTIKWKTKQPDKNYIIVYVTDNWKITGTIIAHLQWSCHDFFVFTKEESCETLHHALKYTKLFDWSKSSLFYAVHQKHQQAVYSALSENKVQIGSRNQYDIWWMPKEEAKNLEVDCPPNVYIGLINKEHIQQINSVWPNRYPGSLEYLETFAEMNECYGLFLKDDNSLVSWIFKVHLGTMAILQTAQGHTGKGYGSLITKALAKKIALDGHDPLGTVLPTNEPSKAMFRKIGFKILDQVYYIHIGA